MQSASLCMRLSSPLSTQPSALTQQQYETVAPSDCEQQLEQLCWHTPHYAVAHSSVGGCSSTSRCAVWVLWLGRQFGFVLSSLLWLGLRCVAKLCAAVQQDAAVAVFLRQRTLVHPELACHWASLPPEDAWHVRLSVCGLCTLLSFLCTASLGFACLSWSYLGVDARLAGLKRTAVCFLV
jgi:hypothetical protein